jgi:hypothetical protein
VLGREGVHALRGVQDSQHIEIEGGAGRVLGIVQRRARPRAAGVVDEHVDAPELLRDGREGGGDGGAGGQICGDEAADGLRRLGAREGDHGRAGGFEARRDRPADAFGPASDDGDPSGERRHTTVCIRGGFY